MLMLSAEQLVRAGMLNAEAPAQSEIITRSRARNEDVRVGIACIGFDDFAGNVKEI